MQAVRKRRLFRAGLVLLMTVGLGIAGQRGSGKSTMETVVNYQNELFGENVYIFSPDDDPDEVNAILKDIYQEQEANQFGEERYSIYFMPGTYDDIDVNVGFYTQVAGLGELPTDTKLGSLSCTARWLGDDPDNHNACCNFWRGVENLELKSNTMWAVSQATYMRRMQIDGALYLHDNYGWCSGGFLADSNIDLLTDSGSQQQWLSRNCNWKKWMGKNWNMVFLGIEPGKSPEGTWPAVPYTDAGATARIQEKPFLIYDKQEGFCVYVPDERIDASGVSWEKENAGKTIPISAFYVAKAGIDTAETMNQALAEGKHLFLTPGIYDLDAPLQVKNANTIVLGTGLATLRATNGTACIQTADVPGLKIAGLLFDAGTKESENLLVVGEENAPSTDENAEKIALSDLFFRVGGTKAEAPAKVKRCVTINSSHVTGDNFWVWRADHGDDVAWDENTADEGFVVNGDDVFMYALMVEHFQKYQTTWNGEDGRVVMYQSEIPYDVPNQEAWMSHNNTVDGYASFHVDDAVKQFEAWGLGIYLYNRDAKVNLNTAMEVPDQNGVKVHNICSVMITGNPGMSHVLNDSGDSVMNSGDRAVICEYENGVVR